MLRKIKCLFLIIMFDDILTCLTATQVTTQTTNLPFFFRVSIIHAKAISNIHKKNRHIPKNYTPKHRNQLPTFTCHGTKNWVFATLPEKLTASILGCRAGSDRNDPDRKLVYFANLWNVSNLPYNMQLLVSCPWKLVTIVSKWVYKLFMGRIQATKS